MNTHFIVQVISELKMTLLIWEQERKRLAQSVAVMDSRISALRGKVVEFEQLLGQDGAE